MSKDRIWTFRWMKLGFNEIVTILYFYIYFEFWSFQRSHAGQICRAGHTVLSATQSLRMLTYITLYLSVDYWVFVGGFSVRYDKFFSQHYMQVSVFLFRLGNPPISESTAAAQAVCLTRCDGWNIISSSQISARQLSVYGLRVVGCNVFFIILPNPKLDSIYLWLFCKRNDNNPCYCYYCLFFLFESCSDTVLKLIGGLRPKRLRLFG